MSGLDRVLTAAGWSIPSPAYQEPVAPLLLSARSALDQVMVRLADSDNDGDDDSGASADSDNQHTGHALFKKMRKRGMPASACAKICAKADAKVKATAQVAYAQACLVMLSVTQAERDKANEAGHSLPDGSYPIENAHQLHSAAVLAASGHGDVKAAKALIRRRARELKVDVTTLPGFGSDSGADDEEKMAASMVALARS